MKILDYNIKMIDIKNNIFKSILDQEANHEEKTGYSPTLVVFLLMDGEHSDHGSGKYKIGSSSDYQPIVIE